jgi:hypothetical protein
MIGALAANLTCYYYHFVTRLAIEFKLYSRGSEIQGRANLSRIMKESVLCVSSSLSREVAR